MRGRPVTNLALWFRSFGDPASVLTLERTELADRPIGTLRVRMIAAPINPSDLVPITGAYRHRVVPPRVAGYEGVGLVIEADERARHLVGRRVLPLRGPGTWQDYVDCDPEFAIPVPDRVDDALAARGYINPLAAHLMLKLWPVREKRVLLTAAGSSCARLLAQWALQEGAREVVGIHRSPEHSASLRQIGVVPIRQDDCDRVIPKADLIFDAVGGPMADDLLRTTDSCAEFISYGLLSGQPFACMSNRARIQRFHLRDQLTAATSSEWQGWFRELWPRIQSAVHPEISPFALADWSEALSFFDRPGRRSKPLLTMSAWDDGELRVSPDSAGSDRTSD